VRPTVVAIAAPSSPSSGNGPRPKIESVGIDEDAKGDRGVARPAEYGVQKEQLKDCDRTAQNHGRVDGALLDNAGFGAHDPEDLGRSHGSGKCEHDRDEHAEPDRLGGGNGGALRIFLSNPARDQRRGGHAESDGDAEHDSEYGLCEANGRDGIFAQTRNEENVHQAEQRLHGHLQHHRNGQEGDGPGNADLGIVAVAAG
jgi:hypothetical protein